MSGSNNKVQASREHKIKHQLHPAMDREEAAAVAGRQNAVYLAQLGLVDRGAPGASHRYHDVQDSFIAGGTSSASQNHNLQVYLEMMQQVAKSKSEEFAFLSQRQEASINAELQMRLLQGSGYRYGALSTEDPNQASSRLLLANSLANRERGNSGQQLSGSMLASLAQQDRLSEQNPAGDLSTNIMLSRMGATSNQVVDPASDVRARILAQTLVEAARTQQFGAAAALLHRDQVNVASAADFSPTRTLRQSSHMLHPSTERISGFGSDPAFDLSSRLMAQHHGGSRELLLSSPSRVSTRDKATQGVDTSQVRPEDSQTEQLLQLYLLQQQQRHQQQQRPP